MRLVITDDEGILVDIPYEKVCVGIYAKENSILIYEVQNNDADDGYWKAGTYDTRTKANAVMGMLHRAYVDGEKIFRFPKNEEVDIT